MEIDDQRPAPRADGCRCCSAEPARIVFGGKVIGCELLSLSPGGAQLCLRSPVDVPDFVTLRLPGGESRAMRCSWQTGLHVGLLAVGADPSAS